VIGRRAVFLASVPARSPSPSALRASTSPAPAGEVFYCSFSSACSLRRRSPTPVPSSRPSRSAAWTCIGGTNASRPSRRNCASAIPRWCSTATPLPRTGSATARRPGWISPRLATLLRRPQRVNLGFVGDTTASLLWRIDNGEATGIEPKVAVILIGANNLGHLHWSTDDTVLASTPS